jgi:hypothetical protein
MPTQPKHVRYVIWRNGNERLKGFLIRAGKFVKQTNGRLQHDPSPWAQEVARIFLKNEEVEEITVMDKDGRLHAYYKDRN